MSLLGAYRSSELLKNSSVQSQFVSNTQVYLPMSYMYGKRGTCKETPLTAAIRGELYVQDYNTIDWNAARNQCAKEDLYYPHPKVGLAVLRVLTRHF